MDLKLGDLQRRDIVNVRDGMRLGFADDVLIDTEKAAVKSLVVYGKLRLFGILGRRPDVVIPWEQIRVIGEDTILVHADGIPKEAFRRRRWADFWG